MKKELIQRINKEIPNVEMRTRFFKAYEGKIEKNICLILDKLKECNYNEYAYKIAVDKNVLQRRGVENRLRLMDKLKENNYDFDTYFVAVNSYALKNRSAEEQLRLLDKVKECGHCVNTFEIFNDPYVLKNRSLEDQLRLLDKLKECWYDMEACKIAINPCLLKNRSIEDQLRLMDKLNKCHVVDLKGRMCSVATDQDIIENRSAEEQLRLMDKLKDCYCDDRAYYITISSSYLKRSIEEQLEAMNEFLINDEIEYKAKNIEDIEKVREYLECLKEECQNLTSNQHIKVKIYKPINIRKEEN